MQMKTAAILVASVCFALLLRAQEPSQPQPDSERQLKAILERLQAIEARLDKLEEEKKKDEELAERFPGMDRRFAEQREAQKKQEAADLAAFKEAIAGKELPANPTKDQVREYVKAVLEVPKEREGSYSSNDPQTQYLKKIGPEHLDVLFEVLGNRKHNHYLRYAIEALIGPGHKQLVLEQLPKHPGLIGYIKQYRWEQDARESVLQQLRDQPDTSPKLFFDVALLYDDEESCKVLRNVFVEHPERGKYYEGLRRHKGIDIDEAVGEAWLEAKNDSGEVVAFAQIAASHGHIDALATLIDYIDKKNEYLQILTNLNSSRQMNVEMQVFGHWMMHDNSEMLLTYQRDPRQEVFALIEYRGTDEEVAKWFNENREKLKFDKQRRVFLVTPAH